MALIANQTKQKLNLHLDLSLSLNCVLDSMAAWIGLGVTCLPRDPRFVGSNPAEIDGFFSGHKNPEPKFSRRDFKLGIPSLRFQAH